MSKRIAEPKGLELFCQVEAGHTLTVKRSFGSVHGVPANQFVYFDGIGYRPHLDADQLDKLAERCKAWAKCLRAQKHVKPVPPKKWEDIS